MVSTFFNAQNMIVNRSRESLFSGENFPTMAATTPFARLAFHFPSHITLHAFLANKPPHTIKPPYQYTTL